MRNGSNAAQQHRSIPQLIRVGYVCGAHGVRGAVRVHLDNPESTLLQRIPRLTLTHQGRSDEYQVAGTQSAGRGTVKVVLSGITRAEQAAALRGATVMLEAAALPPASPQEFYYFEVLGCHVVSTAGQPVGIVEEVFSNGANDIWVVRADCAEYLVPVIEDIVQEMDFAARRIIIKPLPGLLD